MDEQENISILLGDGTEKEYPKGISPLDILEDLDPKRGALVAELSGELVDLNRPLNQGGELKFLGFDSPRGREVYRHTTSHVMAQAVKRLFPEAKIAIGPAIEEGFYYDFAVENPFTPEDLEKIEDEMRKIMSEDGALTREDLSKEQAIEIFDELGETYKVELLEEIDDETVTVYRQGDFIDLCRGPHLPTTGKVDQFKLLSVAGAYWRGDENREMLQRIYGTSFDSEEGLKDFLEKREEAEKRDHRRLGLELDLFSIREEIGPGLVVYHPKGAILRNIIEDFLKEEHLKRGYKMVYGPHIMKQGVWETSGHLQMDYPMYLFEIEGQGYGIKPMNCPAHIYIYKTRTRGHGELPVKYFELGTVYRHERSGVLHGLLRVRGFTQDDAHIFCTPEQLEEEITSALEFAFHCQRAFGFSKFKVALSTRPDKYVGTEELWDQATDALKRALESHDIDYSIDEGEGVFYGPKIDVKIEDALGRLWQGPTIQVDFNLPERFDMAYAGADNQSHTPVMIHRTVLGSLERYIGLLTEHYGGAFPLWLSPVQVELIPIADRHVEYAEKIREEMESKGLRAEVNHEHETTGNKIRKAWTQKIPYMVVVGDKEIEGSTVSVRTLSGRDERGLDPEKFISSLLEEMESRSNVPVI